MTVLRPALDRPRAFLGAPNEPVVIIAENMVLQQQWLMVVSVLFGPGKRNGGIKRDAHRFAQRYVRSDRRTNPHGIHGIDEGHIQRQCQHAPGKACTAGSPCAWLYRARWGCIRLGRELHRIQRGVGQIGQDTLHQLQHLARALAIMSPAPAMEHMVPVRGIERERAECGIRHTRTQRSLQERLIALGPGGRRVGQVSGQYVESQALCFVRSGPVRDG